MINFELIDIVIEETLKQEKINPDAEVSVSIVSDEEIKELNKTHRGKDAVTDVLSFPMINFELGETIPKTGSFLLGDIVFSLNMAAKQSISYEHSIEREIGFFIAHGMLHLLGYDHQDEKAEEIMFKKQEEILESIGLRRRYV